MRELLSYFKTLLFVPLLAVLFGVLATLNAVFEYFDMDDVEIVAALITILLLVIIIGVCNA